MHKRGQRNEYAKRKTHVFYTHLTGFLTNDAMSYQSSLKLVGSSKDDFIMSWHTSHTFLKKGTLQLLSDWWKPNKAY